MSGHSKWSTIKRKKGAADQKRGKIFTRVIHEITTAVREGGGGDPNGNARLRFAIDKAKAVNMPNDNIDRAIKRATGELKGEESYEITYEGYGPSGTAVLVDVVTDNKNRTVGEVRHAFSKCGGNLGETGCVNWMFDKKGLIAIKKTLIEEEKLIDLALGAGADDVTDEHEVWEVTCAPENLPTVKSTLEPIVSLEVAEVQNLPKTRIQLSGKEAEQMMRLLELLDEMDEVLNVSSNCDFVDESSAAKG